MTTTSFKTLIDEALKMNQLSVSKVATAIDVDRSWLQHALVGRRTLGYENFEKIMDLLTLEENLNHELREAFASEYYGESDFYIIQHTLEMLNTMANYEKEYTPLFFDKPENLTNFCSDFMLDKKQLLFLHTLNDIIQNELKNDIPMIYTTYSFNIVPIRMMFLNILRSCKEPINYKHICFAEPDIKDIDAIDTFLYQYEFAGYGYNTYLSSSIKATQSTSPLPFFVATSDVVIFFSLDLQLFLVEKNANTIQYIHNFFNKHLIDAKPFSYFMRGIDDLALFSSVRPIINDIYDEPYYYDLSPNLCFASYIDNDLLINSVSDDYEHKDFFIHGVSSFFSMFTNMRHSAIWHIESLMKFTECDEEICDYHHVTFDILHISPANKYKLLCKLQQYVAQDMIHHFVMNNKIQLPSYFHLNICPNGLVLGFNFKVYDSTVNNSFIATAISQNPILFKHLRNLCEYYKHSPFVYSHTTNYAKTQIDNAINYYKMKHNF